MTDPSSNLPLIKGTLARVMKLLLRILSYSLILIFLLLVVLHIPATQKRIATEISEFLSNRTGGEITISVLKFSILGDVVIRGLEVIDPLDKNVLSSSSIALEFNAADLLFGDLVFKHVQIQGLNGQLVQNKEELSIQFIIDAFKHDQSTQQSTTAGPAKTTLQFEDVDLQDVKFRFLSLDEDIDFQTSIGSLHLEGTGLSISPNKLKINQFSLENTHSSLITSGNKAHDPNVSKLGASNRMPFLDFDFGFDLDVSAFQVKENSFSFHQDESLAKQQFDPDHIDAFGIEMELAGVLINSDSISAQILQITANLIGFPLQELEAEINIGPNQIDLSGLKLVTKGSKLALDLVGTFNDFPNLINELDQTALELSLAGHIDKADIIYFFGDSTVEYLRNWPVMRFNADARYGSGQVDIKELDLRVGNSEFYVKGIITNLLSGEYIAWKNLNINTFIGNEFKKSLSPFTTDIRLPPSVRLRFITSGNPLDFDLVGQIMTSWGNIRSTGSAGLNRSDIAINMTHVGDKVRLGELLDLSWMGSTDFSIKTIGQIGANQEIDIRGSINRIDLFDQTILNTNIQSHILNKTTSANIIIEDPNYRSKIDADISFVGPLNISSSLQLDKFSIGKLISQDTSLRITGDLKTKILMDKPSLQGYLNGRNVTIETATLIHGLDSMNLVLGSSAEASSIELYTDNIYGVSKANFDIQETTELFEDVLQQYSIPSDSLRVSKGNRNLKFILTLSDATLLKLLHLDIKDFSKLTVEGEFNEIDQVLKMEALTRGFKGYGLSLDSLELSLIAIADSMNSSIFVKDLYYDSTYLGNLDFNIFNSENTSFSDLLLTRDSVYLLAANSRLTNSQEEYYLFLDSLVVFNYAYNVDTDNPIIINEDEVRVNQFKVGREEMEISLDGNLGNFDIDAKNLDLRRLNTITVDSLISTGVLNSSFSYNKADKQINLHLDVDSLTIYDYPPIYISGKASNQGQRIPFQFNLNSTTNNINLGGNYNFDNSAIDGSLLLDINDLEVFEILAPDFLDKMGGKIKSESTIAGNINEPELNGYLRLQDIRLITANPKAVISVQDEIIRLNRFGITFEDFTLYDQVHNPLTINGYIKTSDYRSFTYDLDVNTDKYMLINSPQANESQLQGILTIGSDIKLSGSNTNTFISADVVIRDSTHLSYFTDSEDIELISSEGIVDFTDSNQYQDSIISLISHLYYDSLIAHLPKFELKASVNLEENAVLRIILDPRSGDFIEASGTANLHVDLDRSGNMELAGSYSIKEGSYQLSFYDIVKKKFVIAPESNIVWEGDPTKGNLNVRALHTIKTSSTGLISHEVSENEKALYRRALPYEVSINIAGSIDNPSISFGLDLPQEDKANFPVLANKLNRLQQPEFESDLNKQVFGLLVLGGFIPETSGAEFDQSLVATTAISNSVNSILASQLNRFASQYIKGVDIDVGMQSYNDFSTGSGQTRTSVGVKVSKQMMDDRLSFEVGGGMDISTDQSGPNRGSDNFRGDIAIIYDLTESGNKQLKAFNNETYDIIYQQVRNTGISLIFIREFDNKKNGKK